MAIDGDPAITRRSVVVGTCLWLAGCTGDETENGAAVDDDANTTRNGTGSETETTTGEANPATGELSQQGDLSLTSPAFDDGDQIPIEYGYTERNVNPPLQISGVPEAVESLALVMDDPEAVEPAGQVWDHWIVWNIPTGRREIPEDWTPETAREGTNDFGEVGYGGPNPPDETHRYRFKLFAIGTTLSLPTETDGARLGEAMAGHVLAATQLDGTYPA